MNENGQGDVLPKITLEDLRRISQESQTFDEYVDKIHKLCPGHGDVRLHSIDPLGHGDEGLGLKIASNPTGAPAQPQEDTA